MTKRKWEWKWIFDAITAVSVLVGITIGVIELRQLGAAQQSQTLLQLYQTLHDVRPALINFGEPGSIDSGAWADRVQLVDAQYDGEWVLPVIGNVARPAAVLIRPDGYVAWVGEGTHAGLVGALTKWFGPR